MLLRSVTFENFGIYGGTHTFDLTPASTDAFERPVVLFSGKNGVGKTTFVEGIRLCLHGALAVGSRVGQHEYATYLEQRIHRAAPHHAAPHPAPTAVELSFDFTGAGVRVAYRVRRQWAVNNRRLQHDLTIWEDGAPLDTLAPEARETLLRELIPPGLAEIFFFDGEKISALARDSGAPALLATTVNALLGLNLIDQLQRDLDYYLARHGAEGVRNGAHHELEQALARQTQLDAHHADLTHQQQANAAAITDVRQQIAAQEMKIAAEGGGYASQRNELLARRARLDADAEGLRRQAIELASGLLPFAFAPQILHAVRARLALEQSFHEQETVRRMLARQEVVLQAEIAEAAAVRHDDIHAPATLRTQILQEVLASLRHAALGREVSADSVILHVSDKERAQLDHWIDLALAEAPLTFSRTIRQLAAVQDARAAIDADLVRVPADVVLAPLVDQLHTLLRQLGGLEQTQAALDEALRRAAYGREQNEHALRRARTAIAQQEAAQRRSDLAARTQQVLDAYKRALTQRKLALLEQSLTSHFNQLCRKHTFVDHISVDPATFTLTLQRAGHHFPRTQLSAGENQLLAIALLWALRELSGRATPVIIDTPLSRLDSQHRQNLLYDFLPRASHQVIVLATDAEIDAATMRRLAPVLARIYHMEYDPATGATQHHAETPAVVTPNLTLVADAL